MRRSTPTGTRRGGRELGQRAVVARRAVAVLPAKQHQIRLSLAQVFLLILHVVQVLRQLEVALQKRQERRRPAGIEGRIQRAPGLDIFEPHQAVVRLERPLVKLGVLHDRAHHGPAQRPDEGAQGRRPFRMGRIGEPVEALETQE